MNQLQQTPSRSGPDLKSLPQIEQIYAVLKRLAVNGQKFFNVEEAAEFTRLSVKTINRRKGDGILPFSNAGGDRVIFLRADLISFMTGSRVTKGKEKRRNATAKKPDVLRRSKSSNHVPPECSEGRQPKSSRSTADYVGQ